MANELAQAAGLSDLLHQAPPGCVLTWARGVVVGSEIGGKEEQSPFRRVEVADVDDRLKTYDLCIEQPGADFANGDAVSIFGHAVAASPVAPVARVILNHNTDLSFPVYPLPDQGGWDMSSWQYKDWLLYTGKPDIFTGGPGGLLRRGNPSKTGMQLAREGVTIYQLGATLAFAVLVFGGPVLLFTNPGPFFLILAVVVGLLIWNKKRQPPKTNLAPLYQELIYKAQKFALNNPDPDSHWEARPRF